jgi:hypothetical protein
MNEGVPRVKTLKVRRRARLTTGGLVVTVVALGFTAITMSGSASAFSAVLTQGYSITGAASVVSGVNATVSPNTEPATGDYTLKLVTPSALTPSTTLASASWIRVLDSDPSADYNAIVASVLTTGVGVVDESTGYTYTATVADGFLSQGVFTTTMSGAEADALAISLGGSGAIEAGNTITLTFAAVNPSAGSYNFWVATSGNGTYIEAASPVTITASSASPTVTASPLGVGSGASYTVSNVTVPAGAGNAITLQACTGVIPVAKCTPASPSLASGTGSVTFSSTLSSYTVTDTTASTSLSFSTSPAPVNSASGATTVGGVLLTLSVTPTAGHELTITANGVNPTATESDWFVVGFSTGSVVVTGPVIFGGSVSAVAVSVSSTVALGIANYTVGFDTSSTGAMSAGGTITLRGPIGTEFANPTGAVVTDTTTGATQVVSGIVPTTTTTTYDTVAISISFAVGDGNAISITVFSVANPAAGSYSGTGGLSVSTTGDPSAAYNSTPYVIGAPVVSGAAPSVVVTPNSAGSPATYTIGQVRAADALVAGTDTLEITGPSGTEFSGTAALTDATTSSGSQSLTLKRGAGTNDVVYNLTATVAAGDILTITIAGVINPAGTPTGSTYNLALGADSVATNATAAGTQGLEATAPATTTTTTTTTTIVPRPTIAELTTKATVSKNTVNLKLRCSGATCRGAIRLKDVSTLLAIQVYSISAGKTVSVAVKLGKKAQQFLATAKHHTLTLRDTVTVTGGATFANRITVVG